MAKSHRSITRDSVFRKTGNMPVPAQGISKPEDKTFQTAVWMGGEETEWLDAQLQEIKKTGWRGVTRSAFIRALVKAAKQRSLDVSGVTGEAELVQRLSLK